MHGLTLEPLLDIGQIAEAAQLPADAARILLQLHDQRPAASHRGKSLWLRDSVDVILEAAP